MRKWLSGGERRGSGGGGDGSGGGGCRGSSVDFEEGDEGEVLAAVTQKVTANILQVGNNDRADLVLFSDLGAHHWVRISEPVEGELLELAELSHDDAGELSELVAVDVESLQPLELG